MPRIAAAWIQSRIARPEPEMMPRHGTPGNHAGALNASEIATSAPHAAAPPREHTMLRQASLEADGDEHGAQDWHLRLSMRATAPEAI